MRIAFRADASIQIGTGHIMRCLTLADALRERGVECAFVCREHTGHLLDLITQRGHEVAALPAGDGGHEVSHPPVHAAWLGTDWATDAEQTRKALEGKSLDWLIVDHYALDRTWEQSLRPHCRRLMVIDDLADRPHDCDLLLDQTFGRDPAAYSGLVPAYARLLCGAKYAMLRPEFARLRPLSIGRRKEPMLRRILVTMGGVDKSNVTALVLDALDGAELPVGANVTVVMGTTSPALEAVCERAARMIRPAEVLVGVNDMAQLMTDADLAIGAAGATTWERSCVGLPSVMVVLAENQRFAAGALVASEAAVVVDLDDAFTANMRSIVTRFARDPAGLGRLSENALRITDGSGCELVQAALQS